MARVEIGKHLAVDTRVCGGRLIFKGTRIMVADAIELSQRGYSPDDIASQYYEIITPEAVREALSFVRRGMIREVSARATRMSVKQGRARTNVKQANEKAKQAV